MSRATTRSAAFLQVNGRLPLDTTGISIDCYYENGSKRQKKIGTIDISAGSLRWTQAGHRTSKRLNWQQFSHLMDLVPNDK